jgi:hypothetical protein
MALSSAPAPFQPPDLFPSAKRKARGDAFCKWRSLEPGYGPTCGGHPLSARRTSASKNHLAHQVGRIGFEFRRSSVRAEKWFWPWSPLTSTEATMRRRPLDYRRQRQGASRRVSWAARILKLHLYGHRDGNAVCRNRSIWTARRWPSCIIQGLPNQRP